MDIAAFEGVVANGQNGAQLNMHEDEIDINIALVRRLWAEQFPHLAESSITVIRSTGTVNAIYRLGKELYARLPRRQEWAESIDNEWTWLPKLAAYISLDIPKPLAKGKLLTTTPNSIRSTFCQFSRPVGAVHARQIARFTAQGTSPACNPDMGPAEVRDFCYAESASKSLLRSAM